MGAERKPKIAVRYCPARGERGQSILEFVLTLPVMVVLAVMMIKVNTVIQMSIVNQQYARAQALMIGFNSPYYPHLALREDALTKLGYNQILMGVAEKPIQGVGNPEATTGNIARRGIQGSDESGKEPNLRSKVRVRTTVTLCTQSNVLADGTPILPLDPGTFKASGSSNLGERSRFDFCRSSYL